MSMISALKQRGIALITVLLIIALITIIAAEMAVRLQMQIKRVSNIGNNQQAYWYALGGESLAKLVLNEAYKEDNGRLHLGQPWAVEEMTYPLEGGATITGSIKDLNSCFNINAVTQVTATLQNQQAVQQQQQQQSRNQQNNTGNTTNKQALDPTPEQQFKAFLELAGIDSYDAETIRDSVSDWLDADSNTRGYGAEDYMYEAKVSPYLPANSWFVDKSELRLIQGFDTMPEGTQRLDKVIEHICIVPKVNQMRLNVNTIKAEDAVVLAALFDNKLTQEAAKQVIENRPDDGFRDINDFWQQPEIKAIGTISANLKQQFVVTSEYFQLQTKTEYNESFFNLSSVIALDKQGKFTVIARKIGV
ncbi:general secretion pathway protein [Catenovulum agarivorans DS-2]|uniref:Type II secretion system protein K n=1 Tax=Catenovulum agarivorans DS-2 TaxID=1328313 RepID=W7QQH2_9ALTE|nr:type II secretion system minor pseudopilin GspK [Catenovulum agarivorans]EWH11237.1 general secretion pathway protein [Catenovulum agarivorans DS-2]